MNYPDPASLLPHRDPILLVDRIKDLIPGKRITAEFFVRPDMPVLEGHFPGFPILPGVYSIEAMAQTGGCLLLSDEKNRGKLPLFLGVSQARFLKPVHPDDTLEMTAEILSVREDKPIYTIGAEAKVSGETVAVCEAAIYMK